MRPFAAVLTMEFLIYGMLVSPMPARALNQRGARFDHARPASGGNLPGKHLV